MGGIRDCVVLKTGNGIYISMIRLCSDVSAICNRKPWIPGEQDVIPKQYLFYIEIYCFRHIMGFIYFFFNF